MNTDAGANGANQEKTPDWQHLAEENEQLFLEQMEQTRIAQADAQAAQSALTVERQTVVSQHSELQELRRNLERSNGIIRSLEQRLGSLQTNVNRLEQEREVQQNLEVRLQAADNLADIHRAQAEEAKAQLTRANTRLIAVERQLLQLKSVMDRAVFGRSQPLVPVPEKTAAPTSRSEVLPHHRVELPSFLKN